MNHAVLLCASALITASIASVALGIVTMGIVVFARKFKINPDNVSTPIAASLGDMTTLGLLAGISALLFQRIDVDLWLAPSLVVVFMLLIPLWGFIARGNKYTEKVLYSGWIPVISAVLISSVGGCILDYAVERFSGLAVFQPVINGKYYLTRNSSIKHD
ncbi:solute carrier family 41 member 1-like [Centruroides sculpturatus]|uniref:solute carrier family 41 member 1-like n=1 Tax=Centruroides sculpturatus TaxID=218467 RepID=UPI000C6EC537|nr:solute carrier family 41 member 1-like [Centruroides sculpturatus]